MIKNPNDIVEELIADYLAVFGNELVSAVMYGSAVTHEYRPGKSDINIALVLVDNTIKRLTQSLSIQKKWQRKGVSIPLFMTKEYIAGSLDSYPVEFLDMQTAYRILYGEDVLAGLKIELLHLRLQCERELKGVSLRLRSAYTDVADNPRKLQILLEASIRRLLPLFKGLLVLNNRKIPNGRSELIAAVEDLFGLGASVFSEVFHPFRKIRNHSEVFDRFIKEIDKVIIHVDTHNLNQGPA